MLYRVVWKPQAFIKVHPACLTAFIALVGFAMVVAVFLAFSINKDSWSFRLPECLAPRTTPSFLQIQVLGDGNNPTRDVVVDLEKSPWLNQLIDALPQMQAQDKNGNSVSNVVVDPKENPWIDKLINALRDAGKRQPGAPCAVENSIRNVVVHRDENPWIDEMLAVLRNAAKTQVTDATARGYIEQQRHYADDANSSTECPVPDTGAPDAVAPGLSAHIREQMACSEGELKMSGFIRFSNNNADVSDAAEKIKEFVARIDKQASRWGAFGFASESGEKDRNLELSWQRACAVKQYICENNSHLQCRADCKTYPGDNDKKEKAMPQCVGAGADGNPKDEFLTCFLGEQHFINGVADSRSVVIAACKTKE